MDVNFTGAGAYSETAGNAVNFTGAAVAPAGTTAVLFGNIKALGTIKIAVKRGAKDFSGVRPVAHAPRGGSLIASVAVVAELFGEISVRPGPAIEYPYVNNACGVSKRERVTGAVSPKTESGA